MDADGLPLIGPGVDLTKVECIHQKRTLAFLNHFITHTTRFLNHFSCVCEEKFAALTVKIQRLETTMNILEAKLGSIPGLESVTVAQTQPSAAAPTEVKNSATVSYAPQAGESAQPETVPEETEDQEPPKETVSQDPRYAKYFKMMDVGVPAMAIKQKMIMEGLDPALLDTPSAPMPGGGAAAMKADDDSLSDSDSSSGFSD